jgi:hypothetical protein
MDAHHAAYDQLAAARLLDSLQEKPSTLICTLAFCAAAGRL